MSVMIGKYFRLYTQLIKDNIFKTLHLLVQMNCFTVNLQGYRKPITVENMRWWDSFGHPTSHDYDYTTSFSRNLVILIIRNFHVMITIIINPIL